MTSPTAYRSLLIGDPMHQTTLMGPLVGERAIHAMREALKQAIVRGGRVITGGEVLDRPGWFVTPALVRIERSAPIVREETFAPILYLSGITDLAEGIEANNGVRQGLSIGEPFGGGGEGDGRGPGGGFGCVEGLHTTPDDDDQLG